MSFAFITCHPPKRQSSRIDSTSYCIACVDLALGAASVPTRARRLPCYKLIHPTVETDLHLRRKCFSTLERLRIAEGSAQRQKATSSTRQQALLHRHSTSALHDANGLRRADSQPRRRLRKRQSILIENQITQADARWFLALPDKVRRRHFSREEQVLLASLFESVHVDTSEEALYRLRAQREQDEFQASVRCSKPSTDTCSLDQSQDEISQTVEDSSCTLDEMTAPEALPVKQVRKTSFRRTLSFNTNPFVRHSTSSAPTSPLHAQPSLRRRPRADPSGGEISSPMFDPAAIHYMDPEARLKLRIYLASPQKFDEAVEFGFPSTNVVDAGTGSNVARPKLTARAISHDVQHFLRDDAVSFLADDKDDDDDSEGDESDFELDSPLTPADPDETFRCRAPFTTSNQSSLDSNGLPALSIRQKQDAFTQALAGNREMTLRMTLTRPDLRDDEEALYGRQKAGRDKDKDKEKEKEDLLALEELPPLTDDVTGAQGAFAIKPSRQAGLVKRFLSRVKGERR